MARQKRSGLNQGSILIITLWSLFLLTTFAVSLGYIARQKMALIKRLAAKEELRFIAEAGVRKAIVEMREEDTTPDFDALNEWWSSNETLFRDVSLGDGSFTVSYDYKEDGDLKVRYGLIDEERKINLNTSDAETIANILGEVTDLDQDAAVKLAYCIIDWRDQDSMFEHPRYGAEDSDYRFMQPPYESKDSPFELLDELLLVKGMTGDIFKKVRRYVTIYGDGGININTASREALKAVDMHEAVIDKIIRFRKGIDKLEGTADDNIFISPSTIVPHLSQAEHMSPSEIAELSNFVSKGVFTTKSDHYSVQSSAHLTAGRPWSMRIDAVVNRKGEVLRWKESGLL